MSNLESLLAEQERINKAVEEARITEHKADIQTIESLMRRHGMTSYSLPQAVKVEPKWKDPVSGKTWSGRGKTPLWYDTDTVIALR